MADFPDWVSLFRLQGTEVTVPIDIQAVTVTVPISIQSQVANLNVNLAASAVTLNVNIAASAVTLNVSVQNASINVAITASSVTLNVNLTSSSITLNVSVQNASINVSITGSSVTLNTNIANFTSATDVDIRIASQVGNVAVNIAASAVTLNMNLSSSSITLNISVTAQTVAIQHSGQWAGTQNTRWSVQGTASVANDNSAQIITRTVPAGKTGFVSGISFEMQGNGTPANVPSMMTAYLYVAGSIVQRLGSYRGGGITFDTPFRATAGQIIRVDVGQWNSGASMTCGATIWGYDE